MTTDFVLDVHQLSRQAGTAKHVDRDTTAPADWGGGLVGVKQGSPVHLALDLAAVGEGILVTGTAAFRREGQCARCLTPLDDPAAVSFQELFAYAGRAQDDADLSRVEGETLDLEPVVRDAIVLDLPLAPLCEDDCAGLCADCGANLNEDPSHSHGPALDSRWAGLASWVPSGEQSGRATG
jgi:uncharacterized protein